MSDCKSYVSKEDLQALKESQQHIEHVARSRNAAGEKALQVTDPIRGENVTNRTLDGLEDLYTSSINNFETRGEEALRSVGWVTLDSFQQGAEITERNQVLRDETNGEYYRWDGTLPKIVPASSTPESAGGVGMGAWVSVGSASLSADDGSSMVGHGNNKVSDILYAIKSVSVISNMPFSDNTRYRLRGWHYSDNEPVGGGDFIYVQSMPRSMHDGGIIIDTSVPYTNTSDYLKGVGSSGGNGCLVRQGISSDACVSWFGAQPNSSGNMSTVSIQKAIDIAHERKLDCLVDIPVMVDKPLVLLTQSTLKGVSKYKSFIFKMNNSTSGLPPMRSPSDHGEGSGSMFNYDVDAVVIVKPENDGEYATWVKIKDITLENNSNPSSGEMPDSSFGVYAPVLNLSQMENVQIYKVGTAFYSEVCWMTQFNHWRSWNTNHNFWVNNSGTSLVLQNVWAMGCYDFAYFFKGIGYSNFVQVSADGVGRVRSDNKLTPVYRFVNCHNSTLNLSIEDTFDCSALVIEDSHVSVCLQAVHTIRNKVSDGSPMIIILGSDVTFNSSSIKVTGDGDNVIMFVSDSHLSSINSDDISGNFYSTDNTSTMNSLSKSGIMSIGGTDKSKYRNLMGKDLDLRGAWDDSGRIRFIGQDNTLYGTLFANSAGDILWKKGGEPSSNTDGSKLNS